MFKFIVQHWGLIVLGMFYVYFMSYGTLVTLYVLAPLYFIFKELCAAWKRERSTL